MHLFDPFSLKSLTLRNRVGVSPMCMYSAVDGVANDWHLVHLGARAVGGAGLIITEATAVAPKGRITPSDLGLWSDAQVEPLARATRFMREHGAVPGIQLAHAGRKASAESPWAGSRHIADSAGGWPVVGPSEIAFGGDLTKVPRALSIPELQAFQANFVAAAKRALAAGYEWLEIHSAHGYLLHQFLSPISNHRTDEYGGSFDNRIRLVRETTRAVRAVWPERLPLTIRLSCTDWVEGGWTVEETVELCRRLKEDGIDLVDCSSGGMTPNAKVPTGPGYQVLFAERIRREVGLPTAAVGLISEPEQAEEIVHREKADLVLIARASLRDPHWPLHAAKALGQAAKLPPPKQYLRG
ncbi:oxidoreductase [Opitutaceae bacterium EW11]|nr:oxidoreductase [Opitutaceae bacterium EW11]